MARLPRRLTAVATVVSLVLCAGVVVLWVRSYRVSDEVGWRCAGGSRFVYSARGRAVVTLLVADWSDHPEQFHRPRYQSDTARPPVNYLLFLGGNPGDRHWQWEGGGFAWHQVRNPARG